MARKTRIIELENVHWIHITPIHLPSRLMWALQIRHKAGTLTTKVQYITLEDLPIVFVGPKGPFIDNISLTKSREQGTQYIARITHQYCNTYRESYSVAYIHQKKLEEGGVND